ncbi:MAG: type II toxin-antitoxin system RelE/ParE family toxin [Clostridia bacterium]|nr:type II toxin-antitoxin system RelE/ParE family toxin [Clostridia bacterium]
MKYRVEFTENALKQLKKIDRHTSSLILGWVRKNLEGCENPRLHGKGLTANRSGQWRYRVGDYRLLAEIEDDKIIILILNIGHRRDIYDKK